MCRTHQHCLVRSRNCGCNGISQMHPYSLGCWVIRHSDPGLDPSSLRGTLWLGPSRCLVPFWPSMWGNTCRRALLDLHSRMFRVSRVHRHVQLYRDSVSWLGWDCMRRCSQRPYLLHPWVERRVLWQTHHWYWIGCIFACQMWLGLYCLPFAMWSRADWDLRQNHCYCLRHRDSGLVWTDLCWMQG